MKIEGKTFKSVSPDAPMAAKLMEQARKYGNDFITGWPIQLLRYGRRSDRTISFATFQTENGIEDLIAADTMADAIEQTAMIFEVKR